MAPFRIEGRQSLLSPTASSLKAALRALLLAVLFLAAWAWLNVVFNLRYPAREPEPVFWYLLPSIDVCLLLGLFGLLGAGAWRPPVWANIVLTGLITLVRLFRVADGLVGQNYFRAVNLYLDLPLLPDLARLLRSTVTLPQLVLGGLVVIAALAAFMAVTYAALVYLQRFLASGWRARGLFACVVVLFAQLSSRWPAEESPQLHTGLFGASVESALVEQVRFASSAAALRGAKVAEIQAVQTRLQQLPSDVGRLAGSDVLLFLVESYGSAVFRNPYLLDKVGRAHAAFSSSLADHRYFVASSFVDSSTYGGGSWLAHATLHTGVRIADGLEFAVIRNTDPPAKTMAATFKQAGYRTVLVQPGTTRSWPEGLIHGFDRKYYARDLEYEGPAFGWATMPDEYVVDFIHRRELDTARRPLFIEYALVSSHAPWAVAPLPLRDWSGMERGHVFRKAGARRFPMSWSNLREGGEAYAYALAYDFDVLARYITERITRDAFIVIMGDHQPAGSVIGDDPSRAVPVHVISRDQRLIARFSAAGYAMGLVPPSTGRIAGLEALLPDLVERLSHGPSAASQTPGAKRMP